jgi:hypothetical protein
MLHSKHIAVLSLSKYFAKTIGDISFFNCSGKTLPVVVERV